MTTVEDDQTTLVTTVTNINNSFVSTLDHLPCDIVRSLWLIQSLNLTIELNMSKIDTLVRSAQNKQDGILEISNLKSYTKRLQLEAMEECKFLQNGLAHHKSLLIDDTNTMNEFIKMRQENLFKNNKENFRLFKKEFLSHLKNDTNEYNKEPINGDSNRHVRSLRVIEPTPKPTPTPQLQPQPKSMPLKLKIKISREDNKTTKPSIVIQPTLAKKVKKIEPMPPPPPVQESEVYCYCRREDSGRMIACDNPNCKIEWFHYKCVGLRLNQKAPKKWYCKECTAYLQLVNERKSQNNVVKKNINIVPKQPVGRQQGNRRPGRPAGRPASVPVEKPVEPVEIPVARPGRPGRVRSETPVETPIGRPGRPGRVPIEKPVETVDVKPGRPFKGVVEQPVEIPAGRSGRILRAPTTTPVYRFVRKRGRPVRVFEKPLEVPAEIPAVKTRRPGRPPGRPAKVIANPVEVPLVKPAGRQGRPPGRPGRPPGRPALKGKSVGRPVGSPAGRPATRTRNGTTQIEKPSVTRNTSTITRVLRKR